MAILTGQAKKILATIDELTIISNSLNITDKEKVILYRNSQSSRKIILRNAYLLPDKN